VEALFRTWDSHLFRDIAAFGAGATMTTSPGGDKVAGAVVGLGSTGSDLPKWVLVHADAEGVCLFASDKSGSKGRELLAAAPGTFRAAQHRTFGQVQLMLYMPEQPSVALRSKSGLRSRAPARLARAVMDMAKVS
jgi:hypothetical protein